MAQLNPIPAPTSIRGTHTDWRQTLPGAQSPGAEQLVLQAVGPHAYGPHTVLDAPHDPVLSHVDAAVCTPPVQDAAQTAPGTQSPPQAPPVTPVPLTHAFGQVVAAPHCPSEPHVST